MPCPCVPFESILPAEAAHARNCVSPGLQQLRLRQVSEGMLPKQVSSGLDCEARTLKRSCSSPTVSDEIVSQAKNHVTCSVVDLGVHIMIASFSLAVRQDLLHGTHIAGNKPCPRYTGRPSLSCEVLSMDCKSHYF